MQEDKPTIDENSKPIPIYYNIEMVKKGEHSEQKPSCEQPATKEPPACTPNAATNLPVVENGSTSSAQVSMVPSNLRSWGFERKKENDATTGGKKQ